MKLAPCIRQFFDQYLPHIKGVSEHTVQAYRDAFRLFLPFAARFYNIKIRSLRVEHLSSELTEIRDYFRLNLGKWAISKNAG